LKTLFPAPKPPLLKDTHTNNPTPPPPPHPRPDNRDMLASALGRPGGPTDADDPRARRARARVLQNRVVSEAYPESEFHAAASRRATAGDAGGGELRLSDLVAGLGEARGKLGASRKLLERLERSGRPVEAPLPRAVRERQERKAGYEETSKDVTKWQPIVKVGWLGLGWVGIG